MDARGVGLMLGLNLIRAEGGGNRDAHASMITEVQVAADIFIRLLDSLPCEAEERMITIWDTQSTDMVA